jgi:pyruvate/2-oxoglutarate dehydrogenase complex dihydrolipoamide dehydrogenase (E3) component
MERMRSRRAAIAPNDSQERFESLGADVFRGEAHFTSPHEVEVNGTKLRAKNFVIATGTRAAIPPIEGLSDVPYFTNETIFDDLKETPASMIVIGGGPSAASWLRRSADSESELRSSTGVRRSCRKRIRKWQR